MIGGFHHKEEITEDEKNFVSHNLAAINTAVGAHCTTYNIVKVHTQVVAGTNYFFHLTGDDGKHYSVRIHVPLPHTNEAPQVTLAEHGHTHARCD